MTDVWNIAWLESFQFMLLDGRAQLYGVMIERVESEKTIYYVTEI